MRHAERFGARSYDAVVVGARCAGAATAMLLARRGLRVLAVDRGRYGTDTLSTHALMRGGVLQLHRWGLLERLQAAGTPAVRRTTFHYDDEQIAIAIKPRDDIDGLYAPRRTVLDALLVDAAREAGVEVAYGVRVTGVSRDAGGRVRGVTLRDAAGRSSTIEAGIVIGADGTRSTVADAVGAERVRDGRHCTGVIYGYVPGLDLDGYHWYYRPGVSVGAIPTNDGDTCLFVSAPSRRFRQALRFDLAGSHRQLLGQAAPALAAALERSAGAPKYRGFAGERSYLRRGVGPGWALVGDAGFFKDPLTAHGITDALRDAELLARAVATGTQEALEGYAALRDDLAVGMLEITDRIASFEWDLDEVKQLHLTLSKEMNRDVEVLRELDAVSGGEPVARTA